MSSEFKVGDRVKIFNDRFGVVKYGTVLSTFGTTTRYAVADEETGAERLYAWVDLALAPKFVVGDKVTSDSAEFSLYAGPFDGISGEFWVLENEYGKHLWSRADSLTKVEAPVLVPVGTRVRVDRATYGEHTHGMIGVVTSNTETFRSYEGDLHPYRVEFGGDAQEAYAAEVTPVTEPADGFEYGGVTYTYGVPYTDCDGDTWTFERPTRAGAAPKSDSSSYRVGESLAYVVSNYRPLTTD